MHIDRQIYIHTNYFFFFKGTDWRQVSPCKASLIPWNPLQAMHTWWDMTSSINFIWAFSFPLLATLWHMGFLGQGSDPSHSCGNTRTHCARLRIKPMSWHSRDVADPITLQQEPLFISDRETASRFSEEESRSWDESSELSCASPFFSS